MPSGFLNQEAVDGLFQHTLEFKILCHPLFILFFKSLHIVVLDEITCWYLKTRFPSSASRKQLTSCSSTPSGALLPLYLYLTSIFLINLMIFVWQTFFENNSWYSHQLPSGSSWQPFPAYFKMRYHLQPLFQATFYVLTNTYFGWNNKNMSKSNTCYRCLQEAVDELLQHTFHVRIKKPIKIILFLKNTPEKKFHGKMLRNSQDREES